MLVEFEPGATQGRSAACKNVTRGVFVERERETVSSPAAAFDDFVVTHQASLVRYATLLAGSPAQGEDLVQEVLIRLYPR